MSMKAQKNYLAGSLFLLAIFALGNPELSRAADVTFPTFSYNDQELAKVKEWEKTWVGKKVTTENVDQVKDFLSDGVYKAMKDPKVFGADSLWFEVVPYKPYELSIYTRGRNVVD